MLLPVGAPLQARQSIMEEGQRESNQHIITLGPGTSVVGDLRVETWIIDCYSGKVHNCPLHASTSNMG